MLTWAERLILSNQYEILKKLDADNARSYEENQEIVLLGFEIFYDQLSPGLSKETLRDDVAREVIDILNVFRAISFSCQNLGYEPKSYWARFGGFDRNEEEDHYAFAMFLREKQGKWKELKDCPHNSHSNVLDKYRRMLSTWNELGKIYELTAEQIEQIANA